MTLSAVGPMGIEAVVTFGAALRRSKSSSWRATSGEAPARTAKAETKAVLDFIVKRVQGLLGKRRRTLR